MQFATSQMRDTVSMWKKVLWSELNYMQNTQCGGNYVFGKNCIPKTGNEGKQPKENMLIKSTLACLRGIGKFILLLLDRTRLDDSLSFKPL